MSLENSDQITPDEPLRLDDAVTLLTEADAAPDGEAEPDEAEGDEIDDEAGDQPEGEDDAPEEEPASDDAEDDEDEPDPEPVIDPPKFWSSEEKAAFAKAPPEVQKIIAAKDAEYSRQVSLAKEETAEARKEASVIGQVKTEIDKHLQRAQQIFQGKWDGIDWAQWAKDDVATYAAAREEYAAEQAEVQRLQTAQAATQAEEHRQFLRDEAAKLRDLGHPLVDPQKGTAEKQALLAYAQASGFQPNDLAWAGANELAILHKAMLYDKAQANLKASPPKLKTAPTPAKAAPVRPGAPPTPRRETASRQKREVVGRAFATGKMDDAVLAVLAMEKG